MRTKSITPASERPRARYPVPFEEARLGPADVRKCIDAVEEELASAEYAGGVTPESVVTCLGTFYLAVDQGGGNVVLP